MPQNWIEKLRELMKAYDAPGGGYITEGELATGVILLSHDPKLVETASDNLWVEIFHKK